MTNTYHPIYPSADVPLQTPGEMSASKLYPLGTKLEARDGRIWRYALAGGVNLAAGAMGAAEAIHADVTDITQTGYTTSIGDTVISALWTTTNGIANDELIDGWLCVVTGVGKGQSYRIAGNLWTTGDTVMQITLHDPIVVATDATAVMTAVKSLYSDVVVAPTTLAGTIVGVPNLAVTAANYYWAQTKGPCAMIVDDGETIVLGELVGYPATDGDAGSIGVINIDGTNSTPIYGRVITVVAADSYAMVDLTVE